MILEKQNKHLINDQGSKTTWFALTINRAVKSFYLCLIFFTSASIWQSHTREKWEDYRNFASLPAFHTPHMLLRIANLKGKNIILTIFVQRVDH